MMEFDSCFLKLRLILYSAAFKCSVLAYLGSLLIEVDMSSLQQHIKQSELSRVVQVLAHLHPRERTVCLVACFVFILNVQGKWAVLMASDIRFLAISCQCCHNAPAAFKYCGRGNREREREHVHKISVESCLKPPFLKIQRYILKLYVISFFFLTNVFIHKKQIHVAWDIISYFAYSKLIIQVLFQSLQKPFFLKK